MTFLLRRVLVHCIWEKHSAKYENRPLNPMCKIPLLYVPVRKTDNLTTILCRCHEIWEP